MNEQINELKKIRQKIEEIYELAREMYDIIWNTYNKIYELAEKVLKSETVIRVEGFNKLKEDIVKFFDAYYRTKSILDDEEWIKAVKKEFIGEWELIRDLIKKSVKIEILNTKEKIFEEFYKVKEELSDYLRELREKFLKLKRDLDIKISVLEKIYKLENIDIKNRKVYNEDELLAYVIDKILKLHQIPRKSIKKIEFHKKINNIEFDVLVTYEKMGIKTIGIELKESDFDKLVEQIEKREKYVNYIYGVIHLSPQYVIQRLVKLNKLNLFLDRAGLICIYDGNVFVIFKSHYKQTIFHIYNLL